MRPAAVTFIAITIGHAACAESQNLRSDLAVALRSDETTTRIIEGNLHFTIDGAAISPGFSLGFDHRAAADNDEEAAYASANLTYGDTTLRLGRPRSAVDDPRHDRVFTRFPEFDTLVSSAAFSGVLDYGLSLDGDNETFSYGASWHRATDDNIVAVSGQYLSDTLEVADRIVVYGGAESSGIDDYFRFGSTVTQGPTTAGVDITYRADSQTTSRSQLFVDYALNDRLTLGVSGLRDAADDDDPVTRLGMSAAFATRSGNFIQGGVAAAPEVDALFDLSVGFRF